MTIESIWAGWRMSFIEAASAQKLDQTGCVLCTIGSALDRDRELKVIARGSFCYVVMNIYPYTSGHLMVVPYIHSSSLADFEPECRLETFDLIDHAVNTLSAVYHPQGFNLGANLGRAAGAGIADHVHFHVVPRWLGDTNFMTTTAGARVQPESLEVSYDRILTKW